MLRALAMVVVVAALAGCSGDGERPAAVQDPMTVEVPAAVQDPATVEVPCSIAVGEIDDLGPSYFAHGADGGFVALPSEGWMPTRDLGLGRMGSAGSEFEGFRFSKFGLHVRRNRIASLEVVSAPDRAILDYVHPDVPARVVRVGPCDSEREWVVFAGGVWVTEPGCVEVLAASGNESVPVRLPVGAPCEADP